MKEHYILLSIHIISLRKHSSEKYPFQSFYDTKTGSIKGILTINDGIEMTFTEDDIDSSFLSKYPSLALSILNDGIWEDLPLFNWENVYEAFSSEQIAETWKQANTNLTE